MFAIDIEGCFVFEIDDITWEVLEYYAKIDRVSILSRLDQSFPREDLEQVIEELDMLRNQGYILKGGAGEEPIPQKPCLESISLHLAETSKGNILMSKSTAENAVNFLIMKSGGSKDLKIEFIAAMSPLDTEIIEDTCDYAQIQGKIFNKDFKFCLTITRIPLGDGTDSGVFDVTLDFGRVKDVKGILQYLSSVRRERKDQSSTIKILSSALKKSNLVIRANFIPANSNLTEPITRLFDLGFPYISLGCHNSLSAFYLSSKEEGDSLESSCEALAREYLQRLGGNPSLSLYPFKSVFTQVHQGIRETRRCLAGEGSLSISPMGDIYPCHQFLGIKKCRIGNINNHLDYSPSLEAKFSALSVDEKEDCRDCWARYLCGGGCRAVAYKYNNTIARPYMQECDLIKHIVKLGVLSCDSLGEKEDLLSRICAAEKQPDLGLSLKDRQINIRLIEKKDSPIISQWRDNFSNSYFLTEEIRTSITPVQSGEVVEGGGRVALILEDKDGAPIGLFRGWISPPFKKGEISLFAPDKESLREKAFYQAGLSLLQNLFRKWKLHRTFITLLETEREYIEYLEQFGFKAEGLLREQIFHRGEYHNLIALGLLKGELKKRRWK